MTTKPELVITLPRSAADVLAGHVTLECECIDRVYANVYVPRLQYAGGVAHFFRSHRRGRDVRLYGAGGPDQ